MIAAAETPPFNLVTTLTGSLNLPTVLLTVLGGVLGGFMLMRMIGRFPLHGSPLTVGLVAVNLGVVFEFVTGTGSMVYRPNSSLQFLVGHLAYVLLSILYGVALGGGMKLGQRRVCT